MRMEKSKTSYEHVTIRANIFWKINVFSWKFDAPQVKRVLISIITNFVY